MKQRIAFIAVLALFAVMMISSLSSVSAQTGFITRDKMITVLSGTTDFNVTIDNDSELVYYINMTFPCAFNALSGMTDPIMTINSTWAGGLKYSIHCNGETIILNATIAGVNHHHKVYSDVANHIVNTTNRLNFTITCNNTHNAVELYFTGDDVPVISAFIPSVVEIKEKDVGTPTIKKVVDKDESHWTVNESINVTNLLTYTITDVNVNLTYPTDAKTTPVDSYVIASILTGAYDDHFVEYQKKGPYYQSKDVEDHTIQVHLYEDLTNCVGWTFDPSTDTNFTGLTSTSTGLVVKRDGHKLDEGTSKDWKWSNDKIVFKDLTLYRLDDNIFSFSWTGAGAGAGAGTVIPPVTPTPQPIWLQTVGGFPAWIIIGIIAIVVVIVIVAASGKLKK